jgi:tyrocidine synthetase-3
MNFITRYQKFDITLEGVERKGDIHFTFEYRTSLYKKETMQLMARTFTYP